MSRAVVPLILVPCIVAVLVWFVLRGLQGWWLFAGLNDKRPGIVFVAAMIALAGVVIHGFFAHQRQVAVRALAKRMSMLFAVTLGSSKTMRIKHLVVGKGSSKSVFINNAIRGDYQGMQLVMADLQVLISGGESTERQDMTIWFFTDDVAFFPPFSILPRKAAGKEKTKRGGNLAHYPSFSKLYEIASNEPEAVEELVCEEVRSYFRSRHGWQVNADGACIAFVRDGKIAVDEWEMYLREATSGIKLLKRKFQDLPDRETPDDNVDRHDVETLPRSVNRSHTWGAETQTLGAWDAARESKASSGLGELSLDKQEGAGELTPRTVEQLQFEKKDPVSAFSLIDSLVDRAWDKAVRYEEVSEFMHELPPRTLTHQLRNDNVPRVPAIFWFMSLPLVVMGLLTVTWGVLFAVRAIQVGNELLIVFGVIVLLPVTAVWAFFYRKRRVFLEILRDGVCAPAVVESRCSTDDYDLEDWLMCRHKIQVQFWAGEELVSHAVKVQGMQMRTLQRCLDDGTELSVLFLKHQPESSLLSVQLASRRIAE